MICQRLVYALCKFGKAVKLIAEEQGKGPNAAKTAGSLTEVLVDRGPIWGKLVSQSVDALNLTSQRHPRSSYVTQTYLHHLPVHCELSLLQSRAAIIK
jgi:hypothetical protein